MAEEKPRLRFDKVAIRLIQEVRDALQASVPDGTAVVVTVSAPIRLASKTAAAIAEVGRELLRERRVEARRIIHDNAVRIRVIKGARGAAKVAGFVHNKETRPELLIGASEALLAGFATRWSSPITSPMLPLETWRQVAAALGIPEQAMKEAAVREAASPRK